MLNIKIDLVKLSQKNAKAGKVAACYFMPYEEETESDRLARDILAPLAFPFCHSLPNGYKVRGFGKLSPRSCFVLILDKEEKERAYLVRPNW